MQLIGALLSFGLVALALPSARGEPLLPEMLQPYGEDLLGRVRIAAGSIPGAGPRASTMSRSPRPFFDIIVGGSAEKYVSARTAFQVVYPTGWVMIDAGM